MIYPFLLAILTHLLFLFLSFSSASTCSLISSPSFLLFVFSIFPPTPSLRACCLRSYAKRRTLKQRPSHCWSTCAPCRTSCSCRRLSAIASIRMRGNAAWRQPRQWAPPHSSALHPADLYRYQRFDSSLCMLPIFFAYNFLLSSLSRT